MVLSLLALSAGCSTPSGGGTPAPPTEVDRAAELVSGALHLPPRAEIVALADQIAIRASKEGSVEEQARLNVLAADLRVRLHRFDAADADAREALELYAAAARVSRGTEASCRAERSRALLAGEIAHDAATSYRELYLAKRRHAALAADGKTSACVEALGRDLAAAQGFRPSGAELADLEKEGDRAERSGAAETAASGSASPGATAAAAPTVADLVVSPIDLKPAKGTAKIEKIEKFASDGGGRVVIHLSEPTTKQDWTRESHSTSAMDEPSYNREISSCD
jgi:N-acetylmuramoyl-L-alanine amidase